MIAYEDINGYAQQRATEKYNSHLYYTELITNIDNDSIKQQILSDLAMRVLYIKNDEDNNTEFDRVVTLLNADTNNVNSKQLAHALFNPGLKDNYIGNPIGYLNHVNNIIFSGDTPYISPEQTDKVNAFIECGRIAPISPKTVGYERPSTPGGLTSAQWARVFGPR